MAFLSGFAVYFIIWWLTLFAVLPIGLRTQGEEGVIVPGTVESAPARFRGARVLLITTVVSGLIYAAWYFASKFFGFSLSSLPQIVPDFRSPG